MSEELGKLQTIRDKKQAEVFRAMRNFNVAQTNYVLALVREGAESDPSAPAKKKRKEPVAAVAPAVDKKAKSAPAEEEEQEEEWACGGRPDLGTTCPESTPDHQVKAKGRTKIPNHGMVQQCKACKKEYKKAK